MGGFLKGLLALWGVLSSWFYVGKTINPSSDKCDRMDAICTLAGHYFLIFGGMTLLFAVPITLMIGLQWVNYGLDHLMGSIFTPAGETYQVYFGPNTFKPFTWWLVFKLVVGTVCTYIAIKLYIISALYANAQREKIGLA